MEITNTKESFKKYLETDPLRDYFVEWDTIISSDLIALENALDNTKIEEDIQRFLKENPKFLIQHLGGGHGRWVIPKQSLGGKHFTDFLIGEKKSVGFHWIAVELESPKRPMFNKNGDPAQYLNHAKKQIRDWRIWLKDNIREARASKNESGLGLTDIDGNVPGLILIGRRSNINESTNPVRRQMSLEANIEIHSYDFLIDSLRGRLSALKTMNNH